MVQKVRVQPTLLCLRELRRNRATFQNSLPNTEWRQRYPRIKRTQPGSWRAYQSQRKARRTGPGCYFQSWGTADSNKDSLPDTKWRQQNEISTIITTQPECWGAYRYQRKARYTGPVCYFQSWGVADLKQYGLCTHSRNDDDHSAIDLETSAPQMGL